MLQQDKVIYEFNRDIIKDQFFTNTKFYFDILLYKDFILGILYNYIKSEEAKKISFIKISILKQWISKWIFLTSLSETNKLLKELTLWEFQVNKLI